MWKLTKKTIKRVPPVFDYAPIYTVVFAVAMALKLKPKDVLKHINTEKAKKFAKDIAGGLKETMEKDRMKAQKELDKMK